MVTRVERYTYLAGIYTDAYQWSQPVLALTVYGDPVGQASISTRVRNDGTRCGYHSNGNQLRPWRQAIVSAAKNMMREGAYGFPIPRRVGVALDVTYTMRKPVAAPKGTQTLPVTSIDKDHLDRAVGDALKIAGVYVDDSQIIDGSSRKVYPGEHPQALSEPGAEIAIHIIVPWELP